MGYSHWPQYQSAFLSVGYVSTQYSHDPRNPHGSAARGQQKRRERERRDKTNGNKKRETTRPTTKKTKKSDREEKGTGAHRADGGDNARTDTPQREEHAHAPNTTSKRAPNKEAKEREQRREDKVQVNPRQTHYRRDHRGTDEVQTNLL